jgi:hypothetical protein
MRWVFGIVMVRCLDIAITLAKLKGDALIGAYIVDRLELARQLAKGDTNDMSVCVYGLGLSRVTAMT